MIGWPNQFSGTCCTILWSCIISGFNVLPLFRLHEVLMDLQHQQLKQLADWLEVTEGRIKRMGTQTLGPDLENIKQQVEEHKVGLRYQSNSSQRTAPHVLKTLIISPLRP